MGIQRLQPVGGGTDWSKYTPISIISSITPSTTYTPVLIITGKGFLKSATAYGPRYSLRITIDGTVIHESGYLDGSISQQSGLIAGGDILGDGTGSLYDRINKVYPLSMVTHPFIMSSLSTSSNKSVLLPKELFFNQSLKVEIKTTTGTDSIGYEITGGHE